MLFHKDVYMPAEYKLKLNFTNMPITYSKHAIIASQTDKYGHVKLSPEISFKSANVIELETNDLGGVIKLVVRLSYDDRLDIIYVIARGGMVKTVWLNKKSDQHGTLNVNLYKKGA